MAGRRSIITARLSRAGLAVSDLPSREISLLSRVVAPEEIDVDFRSIGGLDDAIATVQERVIAPLQQPELFSRSRLLAKPTGVLLYGPPGTGKTLLASAIAKASGALFLNISPGSLLSKYYGESPQRIEALFSLARRLAPSIIFLDEADGLLSRRGGVDSGDSDASAATKTSFLQAWDGLQTGPSPLADGSVTAASTTRNSGGDANRNWVMVIAATNLPSSLDEAAMRRLPCRIPVPLPDEGGREDILHVLLRGEHTTTSGSSSGSGGGVVATARTAVVGAAAGVGAGDSDRDGVLTAGRTNGLREAVAIAASVTSGFSGADLAEVVRVAAYGPVREAMIAAQQRSKSSSSSALTPRAHADGEGTADSDADEYAAGIRPLGPRDLLSAVSSALDRRSPSSSSHSMLASSLDWSTRGAGGEPRAQRQQQLADLLAAYQRLVAAASQPPT